MLKFTPDASKASLAPWNDAAMSVSICELLRSAPAREVESSLAFGVYNTNTSITGWLTFAERGRSLHGSMAHAMVRDTSWKAFVRRNRRNKHDMTAVLRLPRSPRVWPFLGSSSAAGLCHEAHDCNLLHTT